MNKKAKAKAKKENGRPTDYRPEYCLALIEHMRQGLSFESFAGTIGVNRTTLYNWENAKEEFKEAKEIGVEYSRLFWEKLGIEHVVNRSDSNSQQGIGSNSKSRSINAAVWIANMKNRFGWRDRQPDEHDVVINNVAKMSDEELEEKIKEKEEKLKNGSK